MFGRLGHKTLVVDLDPQSNLTSYFQEEDTLYSLWLDKDSRRTVFKAIEPFLEGTGDINILTPLNISDNLYLVCGDLRLGRFEDRLATEWSGCFQDDKAALRVTTAFYRMIQQCAEDTDATITLMDLGPNLGALNRAATLSADYLVIPMGADMFSLQGLSNLGETVTKWRADWNRITNDGGRKESFALPSASMTPIGYIVLQHAVRLDRPVKTYEKWLKRIPGQYRTSFLDTTLALDPLNPDGLDEHCLATLRHYRSLMPMAHEARKPVFDLRPGDGAIGGHGKLAAQAYLEFEELCTAILKRIETAPPATP